SGERASNGGPVTLSFGPADREALGGINLILRSKPLLTLASSARYRGATESSSVSSSEKESMTDWIERKGGRVFHGKPFSDDTGHFEILKRSASIVRLATLPESVGYRPLLWKWIVEAPPTRLEELANYLALAHHWSFWSGRPTYRARAFSEPFKGGAGALPPWWDIWESFRQRSGLDSRVAARLSSHLEKETEATGGWFLYREPIERAISGAFEWPIQQVGAFLDPTREWGGEGGVTPEIRNAFLEFLGHPNPLPERVESFKKAGEILAAMDAFESDPAAWATLTGALYPNEPDNRRTLYRLLRSRGVRIVPPRHFRATPSPRSGDPAMIELGLTDLYGIGPQIAAELSREVECRTLHDLFTAAPTERNEVDFSEWLRTHERHLNRSIVEL
ncbi:MAG: hypothetical protein KC931_25905, partial [Candidatus Omnitrophica bacterium]|nr:hypothetical protein [Candidatus Omnitrophota bacterium]